MSELSPSLSPQTDDDPEPDLLDNIFPGFHYPDDDPEVVHALNNISYGLCRA